MAIADQLEKVACVICGEEAHEVICSAHEVQVHLEYLPRFHRRRLRPHVPAEALEDRATFTQDYATDIVACKGCGLIFRNPRPKPEAVERAYSQDEYGHERLESMFGSQVELARPNAAYLGRWLTPGARVVEVGSFVGGFLKAGREKGWEMLGVDPGEEVNAFCKEKGLRTLEGTLDEASVEAGSVDAVAIWNTFDQLPDPHPTLSATRRMLRQGGILAVRIPNGECFRLYSSWLTRLRHAAWPLRSMGSLLLCSMAWNNLLAFPYLYGYSLRTLDMMMGRHGLSRINARPDTLVRLSDDQTKRWAVREERLIKMLGRFASRAQGILPHSSLSLAPWMDVYYGKVD